jgi:hypothetical protein
MTQKRDQLSTPRAAAIAGILFAVLTIASLTLIRLSLPSSSHDASTRLSGDAKQVEIALNMVPFAGIAFLWFIGVVRNRLGDREDRLFATVFLGSGLLFVAMMFASAAVAGGLIVAYEDNPGVVSSTIYGFARPLSYEIMNVYAIKMAGVFMISSSSLWIRTGVIPRWIAFLGYALALVLLLALRYVDWASIIFPLWVLLISVYILIEHPHSRFKGEVVAPLTRTA